MLMGHHSHNIDIKGDIQWLPQLVITFVQEEQETYLTKEPRAAGLPSILEILSSFSALSNIG